VVARREPGGLPRYAVYVSQVESVTVEEALAKLSADDRAWLEDRRVEYRELLDYLHDH
jgi:hypothetical protein